MLQLGGGALDFFLCHVGHVCVIGRAFQHVLGTQQIGFALLVARPAGGHRRHVGVLAREGQKLLHVFHDVLAREQKFKLSKAVGVTGKLLAQEGFHGGSD